jgi:hypothetical protein
MFGLKKRVDHLEQVFHQFYQTVILGRDTIYNDGLMQKSILEQRVELLENKVRMMQQSLDKKYSHASIT